LAAILWLTSAAAGRLIERDLDQMVPRRLAETLTWTVDVTGPGALGRFEAGFKGALRVRLMHAMVRSGMNRRPDWNYADWDQPVNQSTLAGTLLLFSLGNVLGSQALGLRYRPPQPRGVGPPNDGAPQRRSHLSSSRQPGFGTGRSRGALARRRRP
jgi:ER-bound oxygenase mpaB/B'/Rubber oxygenase, catalytic domain